MERKKHWETISFRLHWTSKLSPRIPCSISPWVQDTFPCPLDWRDSLRASGSPWTGTRGCSSFVGSLVWPSWLASVVGQLACHLAHIVRLLSHLFHLVLLDLHLDHLHALIVLAWHCDTFGSTFRSFFFIWSWDLYWWMTFWTADFGTCAPSSQYVCPRQMVPWWCLRFAISIAIERVLAEDWFGSALEGLPGASTRALLTLWEHTVSTCNRCIRCRIRSLRSSPQRGPSACYLHWIYQLLSRRGGRHDEVWERGLGQAPSWVIECSTIAASGCGQMAVERRGTRREFVRWSADAC